MTKLKKPCQGGCACGYVRYQIEVAPFIVHCCHCSYCQRQTGSAFVLNALVDASQVTLLSGSLDQVMTASPSGKGQNIVRCPKCRVAVWSHYFMGGIRNGINFIRVGTLDDPNQFPPDVHIFTSTKQEWVNLPENAAVFEKFYEFEKMWTHENNEVRKAMLAKVVEI